MKKIIDFIKTEEARPIVLAFFLFFIPRIIATFDYDQILEKIIPTDPNIEYKVYLDLLGIAFGPGSVNIDRDEVSATLIAIYFSYVFIFYTYIVYKKYKNNLIGFGGILWNIFKIMVLGGIMMMYFITLSATSYKQHFSLSNLPDFTYEYKSEEFYIPTGLINVNIVKITWDKSKPIPLK